MGLNLAIFALTVLFNELNERAGVLNTFLAIWGHVKVIRAIDLSTLSLIIWVLEGIRLAFLTVAIVIYEMTGFT